MLPRASRRVVAIVGRPNVGKSALFNRMAGRRIAIVHAESGVTRDRLLQEVRWERQRFDLVDTGGICPAGRAAAAESIESAIRAQVDAALVDAAAAIQVVDVLRGLHPMDEEVAALLRAGDVPVFVAANKADDPRHDADAEVFGRLGFPVFPVSALHGRGLDALMAPLLAALPETNNISLKEPLRVAVVGRPNVGKSSYVNRLLRSDRVIVSEQAGTTRDSVDVPFVIGRGDQARHYVLIDTAGLRRRGKVGSSVERFSRLRAESSIDSANVVVLVLDAAEGGPTAQDKRIAALALERNKGCMLLVNKWDLARETQRRFGPLLARALPFAAHCPVVFVSARTGLNIRRSIEAIDHVAAQVRSSLPTGVLNRVLSDACRRVQPPTLRGKPLKVYYATQVGMEPVRVRLFVNDPRRIRPAYRLYLIRALREHFGLEGAPVVLQLRARRTARRADAGPPELS